jgi:hypothetical protein
MPAWMSAVADSIGRLRGAPVARQRVGEHEQGGQEASSIIRHSRMAAVKPDRARVKWMNLFEAACGAAASGFGLTSSEPGRRPPAGPRWPPARG